MTNNCQPRVHINTIVTKASQRANAILRCFQSCDPCVLLRAFKVYVRPILEFNTTVWSPLASSKERHWRRWESTTSVHEETLWTKRLLIFRTTSEVKSSKLGTTKDTLRYDSDLSNCFWSHNAEMPRIFPIKRVQYYTWPSVQAHEAAMSWLSETFLC